MEFEQYCWASPQPHQMDHNLIDDLFFGTFPESTTTPASALGNTNNNFMDDPCGNDNARIRRVTLTELTDEEVEDDDDWLMVSDDSTTDNDEGLSSDEIFRTLDEAVQDWKVKLEMAIGDGLKKLRKATKDNKMKMKYLPGEKCGNKRVAPAKNSIVKDWNDEFESAIRGVQSKLDKLARDKLTEVNALCQEKLMSKTNHAGVVIRGSPKKIKLESKKKFIDCRETGKKTAGDGNYGALKQMVRELDRMVAATATTNPVDLNRAVPIYNMANNNNGAKVVATPYEFPFQKYLKYLKQQQNSGVGSPRQNPRTAKIDINQFMAHNLNQARRHSAKPARRESPVKQPSKVAPTKKEPKRETSALLRQEKMKERRQRRKKGEATITNQGTGFSYRLRQYSVNGEEHTIIVRKKIRTEQEEVEDIFKQWSYNLDAERRAKRAARVRKLSHRAQRKEFLRENSYPQVTGPASYADALKKNLKFRPNYIPVEDVMEAWKDCLIEQADKENAGAANACGQPTVKVARTTAAVAAVVQKRRRRRPLQPENYFASWRFNFEDEDFLPRRLPKLGRNYQAEEYFRDWKKNFYVKEAAYPKKFRPLEKLAENIFNDWLHNFNLIPGREYYRPSGSSTPRHHRKPWPQTQAKESPKEIRRPFPPREQPKETCPGTPPPPRQHPKETKEEGLSTEPLKKGISTEALASKSRSNNQRRSKNKKVKQN